MKEIYKKAIVPSLSLLIGFALIELCVILNTFNSYVGGIAENTFFQVSGIFSQMFPVMFGVGCFIVGYSLRGLKPFVFHTLEG